MVVGHLPLRVPDDSGVELGDPGLPAGRPKGLADAPLQGEVVSYSKIEILLALMGDVVRHGRGRPAAGAVEVRDCPQSKQLGPAAEAIVDGVLGIVVTRRRDEAEARQHVESWQVPAQVDRLNVDVGDVEGGGRGSIAGARRARREVTVEDTAQV